MQPSNDQAIFYLQFVNAAYEMYEANRNDLTPPPKDFPDTNYQILTYLTSIDPASGSRVFFGFIAADSDKNAGKPGILAIRGTDNFCEWMTDFDATPVPFPPFANAYVAKGFNEFLNNIEWISVSGDRVDVSARISEDWPQGFVVVGHSLGGALATLLTATWLSAIPALMLTLVTAACPACGDWPFYQGFGAVASGKSWRYINELDVVASSLDLFYYQVDTGIDLISDDIWPTPTCEHSLETYIYLLSPANTPCEGNCCIYDLEAQQGARRLAEQRRAIAARSG